MCFYDDSVVQRVLKSHRKIFRSIEKKDMDVYKYTMSLNYPAIRPKNPAGKHLPDIRPDNQILKLSKNRISGIRLSGQFTIQCFPSFVLCEVRRVGQFCFCCQIRKVWHYFLLSCAETATVFYLLSSAKNIAVLFFYQVLKTWLFFYSSVMWGKHGRFFSVECGEHGSFG